VLPLALVFVFVVVWHPATSTTSATAANAADLFFSMTPPEIHI
jgi:hypothetical protein